MDKKRQIVAPCQEFNIKQMTRLVLFDTSIPGKMQNLSHLQAPMHPVPG
jgi:hypothetical protein